MLGTPLKARAAPFGGHPDRAGVGLDGVFRLFAWWRSLVHCKREGGWGGPELYVPMRYREGGSRLGGVPRHFLGDGGARGS